MPAAPRVLQCPAARLSHPAASRGTAWTLFPPLRTKFLRRDAGLGTRAAPAATRRQEPPTHGWWGRGPFITSSPIQPWGGGPRIAPNSPHGARPLLLAGAGHPGVEGGAGVQGGLLPKTLAGGTKGDTGVSTGLSEATPGSLLSPPLTGGRSAMTLSLRTGASMFIVPRGRLGGRGERGQTKGHREAWGQRERWCPRIPAVPMHSVPDYNCPCAHKQGCPPIPIVSTCLCPGCPHIPSCDCPCVTATQRSLSVAVPTSQLSPCPSHPYVPVHPPIPVPVSSLVPAVPTAQVCHPRVWLSSRPSCPYVPRCGCPHVPDIPTSLHTKVPLSLCPSCPHIPSVASQCTTIPVSHWSPCPQV